MTAGPLRMYWWRYDQQSDRNFGDEITPVIVEQIFGRRCVWAWPHECDLVGAGSIVELLLELKGANRPVLWGTGFMRDDDDLLPDQAFDAVAVRGARSRDRWAEGRDAVLLGDPGLLADALVERRPAPRYRLGVLPHFLDVGVEEVDWLRTRDGVHLIRATDDPRSVVEQIAQCEVLLSSSLHGLIVADSLGVPNAHLRLSDNKFIGGMFKFRDYYSAFADPARYFRLAAGGVLGRGVEATAAHVEERFRAPADLPRIKQALIAAFPYR